jgi:putative addiction module component (TIGR02574 family)
LSALIRRNLQQVQETNAMTEETKTLSAQARKLSPDERIELVDAILASLDEPDPAIDRLWAREAENRLAAYRRGEIKASPLQGGLAKYRVK